MRPEICNWPSAVNGGAGCGRRRECRVRHDAAIGMPGADARTGPRVVERVGADRTDRPDHGDERMVEQIERLSHQRQPHAFENLKFARDAEVDVVDGRIGETIARQERSAGTDQAAGVADHAAGQAAVRSAGGEAADALGSWAGRSPR